jgi:hypothetical protein
MRYRCSIVTVVAVLALTVAQGVASAAIVPSGWTLVGHGVRSGSLYRGSVPGAGAADLYLPHGNVDHPLPIVYIDGDGAPATLAGETGIENLADQLTWDGTAPSFAALILDTPAVNIARTVAPWVRASLPIARRSPATLVGLDAEAGPVLGEALAHKQRRSDATGRASSCRSDDRNNMCRPRRTTSRACSPRSGSPTGS